MSADHSEAVPLITENIPIGRLILPTAGKYVINAKVSLRQTSSGVATGAICELAIEGTKDEAITSLGDPAQQGVSDSDAIALQLVHTTSTSSSATLSCRVGNETTAEATNARITAIKVDSITDGSLQTS